MPRVLISDSLAPQGLEILETRARHRGRVRAEPLARRAAREDPRGRRAGDPQRHQGDARGLRGGGASCAWSAAPASASTTSICPRATERGVVVVNTPSGNNVTTAEHAIALLIALARHIPQATASMKAGKWEKNAFTGMELSNRTLGVIGLGNIGRVAAQKAQGLGMRVIAFDPHLPEDLAAKLDVELVDLDATLRALRRDHRPRAEDQGHGGPAGRRGLREVQAGRADRERGARRHRRREGAAAGARERPGGRRRARRLRAGAAAEGSPAGAAPEGDLHAAPRCLDRAGAAQRRDPGGGAGPRLPARRHRAQRRERAVGVVGDPRAAQALPRARREARPLPGPALPGQDRGDRDRVRRRRRGSARRAGHDRRAEGPARERSPIASTW